MSRTATRQLRSAALVVGALLAATGAAQALEPAQQAVLDRLQALHATSGPDAVAAHVADHLPAARARNDSTFVMRLVGARGASRTFHGQSAAALDDLAEARGLAHALGDSTSLARTLVWLAHALEQQGQPAASADAYGELAAVGRALDSPFFEGRGLIGTAWSARLAGRHDEAIELYTHGAALAWSARDTFAALWAGNGLGICRWDQGDLAVADSILVEVVAQSRAARQAVIEAAALNNHAGLLDVLGRPDEALAGYRASRDLHQQAGRTREAVPSALNVARSQHRLGQRDAALASVAAVLAACRAGGYRDLEGPALVLLARLQLDGGRADLAAESARRGLADRSALAPRHELQLRFNLARALAASDSLASAQAEIAAATRQAKAIGDVYLQSEAAQIDGDLLLRTGDPATAAAVTSQARQRAATAGLINLELALGSQAGAAYLAAGDTARAAALLHDTATVWEAARALPEDPTWRERRASSARQLYTNLAAITLAYPATRPRAAREALAFELLQGYKARTMLERALGPGRQVAIPAPVSLAQLQSSVLRPGEVLADCYLGDRQGWLLVVTCDTLAVVPLAGSTLVADVIAALDGQLDTDPRWSPAAFRAVAAEMLTGAGDLDALARLVTNATTVFWSPDGPLHRLPAAALGLVGPASALARIPSATFLASLRGEDPDAHASGAMPTTPLVAMAGRSDRQGRLLAGAEAEVAWLGRTFAGVSVLDDATTAPLPAIAAATPAAVLHLAAHAEVDDQHPWNSAVMLGDTAAPRWLRAGEVAAARLPITLAVLASCRTADGAVLAGEGVVGMAAGFLAAGTPAVVATLWPVDDQDAQRFTRRFYRDLEAGHTAGAALRRTQVWLAGQRATARPRQWAGYVLLGDPELTVPLQVHAGQRRGRLLRGIAGVLATVVALVVVRAALSRRQRAQRNSVQAAVAERPRDSSRST